MIPSRPVLIAGFWIALIATCLAPSCTPALRTLYFLPCLCAAVYRWPLKTVLWQGMACGFVNDLLSSHSHLGLYAASTCALIQIIHRLRYQLFADQISTLPLLCAFAAVFQVICLSFLCSVLENTPTTGLSWWIGECLAKAFMAAVLGAGLGSLPSLVFGMRRPVSKRFQRQRPS